MLAEHDLPEVRESGRSGTGQSERWPTVRGRLIDAVVVVSVFVYNAPIQFAAVPDGLWSGAGLVLSVGLCLPYLWRRQRPLLVFGLIFVVALVQLMLGVELLVANVMLLLALYNVASRASWKCSIPSAAALIGWTLIAGIPLISKGYLSIGELGVLVLAVVWVCTWGMLVGTRRKYMDALRSRAEQLERERDAEARAAAAKERARIAREMHDVVSHNVGAVGIMADGAAAKVDSDPAQAKEAMLRVRDTSRKALGEMRTMLGVLRNGDDGPETLPQPGLDQLDALIAEFRSLDVPVELTVRGEPSAEVPSGVQLSVYRVVQESLTNVRKHAGQVSHVGVRITYASEGVQVQVDDDGQGYTAWPDSVASGGHGIVGMRERVHAYGGHFEAGMRPAGGYLVRAWFPLADGQEDQR